MKWSFLVKLWSRRKLASSSRTGSERGAVKPVVFRPSPTVVLLPCWGRKLQRACTVGDMPNPRGSHGRFCAAPQTAAVASLYGVGAPLASGNVRIPALSDGVGMVIVTGKLDWKMWFS